MRNTDLSTMMTTAEAAIELGITQRRVVQLISTGVVTGHIVVGKTFLIPRDQVEQAKQRNTKSGPPKQQS